MAGTPKQQRYHLHDSVTDAAQVHARKSARKHIAATRFVMKVLETERAMTSPLAAPVGNVAETALTKAIFPPKGF